MTTNNFGQFRRQALCGSLHLVISKLRSTARAFLELASNLSVGMYYKQLIKSKVISEVAD